MRIDHLSAGSAHTPLLAPGEIARAVTREALMMASSGVVDPIARRFLTALIAPRFCRPPINTQLRGS